MTSHGFFATSFKQARAGDQAALNQLLGDFSNQVHNYVNRNATLERFNDIDHEDIVQETLAGATKAFDSCQADNPLAFRSWLLAIAENRIREQIRFRSRQKRKSNSGKNLPIEDSADQPANFRQRTPSSCVARNEAAEHLANELADLPTDYERVLDLRFLQQKDVAEVAKEMDRSTGAVRGLIQRATMRLRETLGPATKWLNQK